MDRRAQPHCFFSNTIFFPRPKLIPSGMGKPTRPHPLPRLQGLGQDQITSPLLLFLHLSMEKHSSAIAGFAMQPTSLLSPLQPQELTPPQQPRNLLNATILAEQNKHP